MLVAGGIGVTPLIAMAAALHRQNDDFTLRFCAHDRTTAPFLDELERAPFGNRVELHLGGDGAASPT